MFLTGYHGTTSARANKILASGSFKISKGNSEWLGKGIYFYNDLADAYKWRESEAIMHSVIKVGEDEYLDIDSRAGSEIYNEIIDYICSSQNKSVLDSADVQKNQCAVMKMLWETYPKLKVVSASFHTERTKIKTLLDRRPVRKEFCVKSNDCIKVTQMIKRSDLDD